MKSYQAMYDAFSRIFASGPRIPRGQRRHRQHRRFLRRMNFRYSPKAAKTSSPTARIPTTQPMSGWLKPLAPATARPAPTQALTLVHTPQQKTCEDVGEIPSSSRCRHNSGDDT